MAAACHSVIADGSGSAAREAGISLLDERHHRFDRVGGRELVRLADAFSRMISEDLGPKRSSTWVK